MAGHRDHFDVNGIPAFKKDRDTLEELAGRIFMEYPSRKDKNHKIRFVLVHRGLQVVLEAPAMIFGVYHCSLWESAYWELIV